MKSSLKILFMGSPAIAVPCLESLLDSDNQVIGVVCQPDKPAGRGRTLTSCAVAVYAKEKNLPLFQPQKIKGNADFFKTLEDLKPDFIAVCAYGKILPKEILNLPPLGCVNVHFSLLPKYRGAAPIQWALMNEEQETGVTTFYLTEKLDAGPLLLQKKVSIQEEDTTDILSRRLSVIGARLLMETVEGLASKKLKSHPQEEHFASYAPPLKKENGRIDWSQTAKSIYSQIRGVTPWPGAFTFFREKILKIHRAQVATLSKESEKKPGEVISADAHGITVACGRDALLLKEVQLEGGKKLEATAFLQGHSLKTGTLLGEPIS